MITHVIYHIPGRKVGCTKNLKQRIAGYIHIEKVDPGLVVLEELHDKTDQEAGDREWWWANHFGYKKQQHYARSIPGQNSANAYGARTFQQRSEAGMVGGKIAGRNQANANIGMFGFSKEQRKQLGEIGGYAQRVSCPHCGITSNKAILARWHFNNCPHRPVRRTK